jgi:2-polyprenyl-6-methoxyphenol hydroxylase-like FAD-dependent oxidoreductase
VGESARRVFARVAAASPVTPEAPLLGTAVVLGGSVAGLLAARVLADFAEQVLVIEPDDLGPGTDASSPVGGSGDDDLGPGTGTDRRAGAATAVPGVRPGVPHGGQAHTLLPAGRVLLDRWFPGFTAQATAAGATLVPAERTVTYLDGEPVQPAGPGEQLISSRPFLEHQIRLGTLAAANVRLLTGRATGLRFDGIAVSAVRYVLADGTEQVQPADLVVDAMGRSSRLADWLERAGWERPPLTRLPGYLDYATGWFRRGPEEPELAAATARYGQANRPAGIAAATANAVEGGRWMVLLAGHRADAPELDFVARCRAGLPPVFAEATEDDPLGEIDIYLQADCRRRDFHRLIRAPARLVAVGDAVAADHPVHRLGLSSAALHACCLAEYLTGAPDLTKPARAFFELQRVVVDAAWQLSTADDSRRPAPDRPLTWSSLDVATLGDRARRWLSVWVEGQVGAAAARDPLIAGQRAAVRDLLAHPATLSTPAIALRAVLVNQRARLRRRDPAPPARPAPAD